MPYILTSDKTQIYYEENGEGKTIIFIHCWATDHTFYDKAIDALSKKYHCIAYDLRGCGASSTPYTGLTLARCARDLKQLIETLALNKVTLFGLSLGASVIYSYVREFGCEHLDRVILADMPPRLLDDDSDEHPWKWGLYRGNNSKDNLLKNLARMFDNFDEYVLWHMEQCMPAAYDIRDLPDFIRPAIGTELMPEEARNYFAKGYCRELNALSTIALAFSSIYEDYRDVLPKIIVPAAVFYPVPGSIYLPEAMEYVASNLGGYTETVKFSPGTHMFMIEHPEKALHAIDTFMEKQFDE
jgi:pimeloyl-ACP methyl ester carboxylesterase